MTSVKTKDVSSASASAFCAITIATLVATTFLLRQTAGCNAHKMIEIPATLPTGRALRWLLIAVGLLTLVHLFDRSFSTTEISPVLEATKSSFDWSTLPAYHPIASLQTLPTAVPKKLKRVQHLVENPHHYEASVEQARCKTIRLAAEKAWKSLRVQDRFAKGQIPMRTAWQDPFAPSTVALIESLDTLWIMGLKREFSEGVQLVGQLDWNATIRKSCEVRATTAKMLGGLLAAYDLSKEKVLLTKAQELGDMLYMAFDTPNHMP